MNNMSQSCFENQINQTYNSYENELIELRKQLEIFEAMTEEEVAAEYYETKSEIIEDLKYEIELAERRCDENDDDDCYDNTLDPAFSSMVEFFRMVI